MFICPSVWRKNFSAGPLRQHGKRWQSSVLCKQRTSTSLFRGWRTAKNILVRHVSWTAGARRWPMASFCGSFILRLLECGIEIVGLSILLWDAPQCSCWKSPQPHASYASAVFTLCTFLWDTLVQLISIGCNVVSSRWLLLTSSVSNCIHLFPIASACWFSGYIPSKISNLNQSSLLLLQSWAAFAIQEVDLPLVRSAALCCHCLRLQ